MNRPLTAEYIVELFEGVKDCQSKSDWKHNKKRFVEIIKEYGTEQCNIVNVVGQSEQCDHDYSDGTGTGWNVCKKCGDMY